MAKPIVALLLIVAAAASASAQTPTSRLVGRVLDAGTGEPVDGVRILLFPGPGTVLQGVLPRVMTNGGGMFGISGVRPGRWRVQADKPGYVTFGLVYTGQMTVDVSGDTVTVPDIRLDRGGVITGRVSDAKGNGMIGVMVQVIPQIPGPDGSIQPLLYPLFADTNDHGEFRLAGLPAVRYLVVAQLSPTMGPLSARPPQAAVTYVPTYYPGFSDKALASPVSVVRGATTNGIDFTLLAVATRQVSGIVVDPQGRPVKGALVRLTGFGVSMALLQSTPTANDGTFRIVNVPDGKYVAMGAIPSVVRPGSSLAPNVDFGAFGGRKAGVEFVVQGSDVADLRIVLNRP